MKSNIDLTANLDFAKPTRFSFRNTYWNTGNVLGKKINKDIADINYCITFDIEHHQHGGIIQGNRHRREYMATCNEIISYCERCGRHKKYPWENFNSLLCPQCNNILDYQMNRVPWVRN